MRSARLDSANYVFARPNEKQPYYCDIFSRLHTIGGGRQASWFNTTSDVADLPAHRFDYGCSRLVRPYLPLSFHLAGANVHCCSTHERFTVW